MCNIFIVWSSVLYSSPVSKMCCANLEFSPLGFKWYSVVLVVLLAILRFVFQNKLVTVLVSGPIYVKVAHFIFSFSVLGVTCERFVGNLFVFIIL
jgi:hypothetical protein